MANEQDNLVLEFIIKALEKLDKKMDSLETTTQSIDKTLAQNTVSLEEHIRRTEAAEAALDVLKTEIKPVLMIYHGLIVVGKLLGIIALLIGIIGGLFEAAKFLLKV